MTIQITVRLPDDEVAFVDRLVHDGVFASRAAGVSAALRRERRCRDFERDIQILLAEGADPDDLDDLARRAARTPMPDLD